MIARAAVPLPLASLVAALALSACTATFDVPVETPIQPKLDVSPFQRVLVVGFVSGGTDDVDANMETVRLLRSQLRTKSSMRVIETDVVPVSELMAARPQSAGDAPATPGPAAAPTAAAAKDKSGALAIKDEKELEAYDSIFANTAYWKKLGEEFQGPLIITGTILFTPHARSGFVQKETEQVDQYGRRSTTPVRTYMERKGYILRPKFVFIDGRTGATLYSETFREEVLYNPNQETPALSSYFELMDRLIPGFLGTLSSQKIRGTRILLK
jgi:hypothetical protein